MPSRLRRRSDPPIDRQTPSLRTDPDPFRGYAAAGRPQPTRRRTPAWNRTVRASRSWRCGPPQQTSVSCRFRRRKASAMGELSEPFKIKVRRVLTSVNANGNSYVMADGEPGDVLILNGCRMVRLWQTEHVPADIP